MGKGESSCRAGHHRGPHENSVGIEFPLSVTEIVRENQTTAGHKGTESSLNQVLGSVLALRAADMAENCEVVALVFDFNGVKVTRPTFDRSGRNAWH